ncbi:MAG: Fur family transcriptional regulator [Chloroflexota bacterium]
MASTRAELADRLRKANLRVTAQRIAILAAIDGRHDHPTVDEIIGAARERLGSVSVQAVYEVLRALTEANLLRRIEPAHSPARYETRVSDNHHHIVCRECDSTTDVDCVTGLAPCLDPSSTNGFAIDEAEVTFWGICPACQARRQERAEHAHERADIR